MVNNPPNDWVKYRMGDVVNINPKISITKDTSAPFVEMSQLNINNKNVYTTDFRPFNSGTKFADGDTLMARITPCLENGKICQYKGLSPASGSTEFNVLRGIDKISDANFIYYHSTSPLFHSYAISQMTGTSGRKRCNDDSLKNYVIHLPSLLEQKHIASVLSSLDDKIETNDKINKLLESIAKTLYDYWFVQFDFPNENGKPYKSSGGKMKHCPILKRDIPKSWTTKRLNEISPIITGKKDANFATKNGEYSFFTCGKNILKCDEFAFSGKSVLLPGNGKISSRFYNGKFNAYQRTYVLLPNNQDHHSILYFSVLNEINTLTSGARGSIIKFITKPDVENITITLPKESDLFVKLNNILDKILINRKENQRLAEIRDFLLPMLMNGQVRIIEK